MYLLFFGIKTTSEFDSFLLNNGPRKLYNSNRNQRIFKNITISQSDIRWVDRDKKTKGINKLRNRLIKKLF